MMKITFLLVSGLIVTLLFSLQAKSCNEQGQVYHEPFEIDRVFGLNETTIEEYGCKNKINKTIFISMLQENYTGKLTSASSVKAKIIFQQNDIYYIDSEGIVRHGDDYFTINKDKFRKELEFISCPSHN